MGIDKNILPIFSSDASIGKSILTTDEAAEIDENAPISIFSIAKAYNLDKIIILDNSMVSFINCYKNAQKLGKQLIFGVKFKICSDAKDQSEASLSTLSNICIWMKNSNGYKDLIKLYSIAHANKETFYYTGRLDWKSLKDNFSNNLYLTFPFYNSFIHNNLQFYSHRAIPEIGDIPFAFQVESHDLPYDNMILSAIKNYCNYNKCEILDTHNVYSYKNADILPLLIFRCINNRSVAEKPELSGFGSDQFSFESWLNKNGKSIK